ncbi:MAG TPA: hypothetical protein VHE36_11885 [Sphingomicrobium sp.]|jgi:uncharacterized membrane protein|nr:hypothetical protein [Sphingomicrobium sp.]
MADDNGTEREHTTVVETGNGGGGGGVLAVVLLIIVVLVLLYLFRGQLGLGGHSTNINVPNSIDVNVNHS